MAKTVVETLLKHLFSRQSRSMLLQSLNSNYEDFKKEKLKCLRFDLEDPEAQYILFQKFQVWKYPSFNGSKEMKEKTLYTKVKSFKSKSELDLWCSINGSEYEFADKLCIVDEDKAKQYS